MFGSIIFLIGIVVGLEFVRRYMRKMKTKYSPEDFKKQLPQIITISFLIEFLSIVLGMMLGSLVENRGLQVISCFKYSFLVCLVLVAMVLLSRGVDILLPLSVNKKQNNSVKKGCLFILSGFLIGGVAYILLPFFL